MMSIDQQINDFFAPVSAFIFKYLFYSVPIFGQDVKILLIWIMSAAFFFTLYLGFVNFRYFFHGFAVALGKYDDEKDDGQISSFEALMASMSGTVGLGNIAGVAIAVTTGGPGAVFWMVFMGVLSMSTKFAEVTLGMIYRLHPSKERPDRLSGGPMYFLRDGFKKKGYPIVGKVLSIVFAICCLGGAIGGGNMFQANQSFQQVLNISGGDVSFWADKGWLFGLILAVLTGIVIIGGIKSIANVASKIVPVMGIIYATAGIIVIAINYPAIPGAFAEIFRQAFSLEAGLGGILGALLVGVQRAAFSNEAGLGTAAVVYSAARAKYPAMQGMASMIGPFIDTVCICTITALVIIISGAYGQADGMEGIQLTSRAFATGIDWFPYVLALAVCLFAYSTIITFSYYGVKCISFIFGESETLILAFKIFFCLCIIVGSSVQLSSLIDFTDGLLLSMAVPNIIGLYVLAGDVKTELKNYLVKMKI